MTKQMINFGKCLSMYKMYTLYLKKYLFICLFEFVDIFSPSRATNFKKISQSLLLKLCFHDILFLFLIIFTVCIYLLCGLGQEVLCSLHALHTLCSSNALPYSL